MSLRKRRARARPPRRPRLRQFLPADKGQIDQDGGVVPGGLSGELPYSVRRVLHALERYPVASKSVLKRVTGMDDESVRAALQLGRWHGVLGSLGRCAQGESWALSEWGERRRQEAA